MPNEIEHKYLMLKEAWKPSTSGVLYRQGYLSSTKERVVRVRIAGDKAVIAEIELANDSEKFALPPWAAAEVSDDLRYLNSNLVLNPYKNWRT